MKRFFVLTLCMALVLPMVLAMTVGVGATAADGGGAPLVSTDKSTYYPGEDIKVSATYTCTDCWVGIVPADENGDPIISEGTIYWDYVPAKGLADYSIRGKNAIGGEKATKLATAMGVTVDKMMTLPAGDYFMAHINSSKGIVAATKEDPALVTYTPFTINYFTVEKTAYTYGESIMVTPLGGSGTDWIGISAVADDGTVSRSIRYIYIDTAQNGQGIGAAADIREGSVNGSPAESVKHLPAGRYVLYFVPNNGGFDMRDQCSEVYIDVLGATVEKTEFKYGEPIMVTGYGSGKDWVGIAQLDSSTDTGYWSNGSIRYRYITYQHSDSTRTGFGSGVAFDIRQAYSTAAAAARADIPAGEYVIFVGLNDCYASDVSPYTYIHITVTAEKPAAPTAVSYALDDKRTGLAGGTLTVTFNEADMEMHKKPTRVELYWGDADGNALAGYGKIGDRKITGATTEIEMTASMVIPKGAKKLMVRAYNGAGTATAVAAELPADRGYRSTGSKVTSFQIVSDMHIGGSTESEAHANMMFADIMELDPNSVGIFVAGDAADHGQVAEYERLFELWNAANQNGLVPKLYIGVGNHEMMKDTGGHNYNNDYSVQSDRFLEYANKSLEEAEQTATPYYYVNRGGQHFIFLATEYCGTHAYLSDAQLIWLSAKLAEVAADGAPVFIMLHQPLYNTVAGGLASEDGSKRQGWHGVIAGDANMEAWRALVAENGKSTSDHGLMYGQYEQPLRDILAQYPSAMMFNGHSHWIMESLGNIYESTEAQPNYMFNTASVSYLWTDHDELNGGSGTAEGSQGYFVTVYENCIEFRGRDFVNGTWIPNAYYRIWLDCAHEYENDCTDACKWCGETREAPHAYENACDSECNVCGETRTVGDHIYDNETCDADCNECGTIREVTHVYESACDSECNVCGETRTVGDHIYDNETCDTDCNQCGAIREVTHAYENACDTECNACHEIRTVGAHVYDNETCDTACNACGAIREVTHAYENACDGECNVCGETRTVGDHIYDNETCDADCNECGATREVTHVYENACDTECNACHEIRTVGAHVYDNETCDADCNVCGAVREVTHAYENACDSECNVCGETRTVGDHIYDNETCDTDCNQCGATREVTHAYENACDSECNVCGETRTVGDHIYDNETCDAECNECGSTRDVTHSYDNATCDAECNVCGAVREVTHVYENACDSECNVCSETRTVGDHIYDNETCDTDCNECGAIRTAEHVRTYPCDVLCAVCELPVEPLQAHSGAVPCSSYVCKYGCGTSVTPGPHEGRYACSTSCRYNCGTLIKHEEHTGAYFCSDTCQYCGISVTPGEHTYGETEPHDTARHKRVCACGEAVYEAHAWDEGRQTLAPTATAEGERTFTCTECAATATEPIEKLPAVSPDTNGSGSTTDNNASVNGAPADEGQDEGLGTGVIVAIAVCGAVVLGGCGFVICRLAVRKKKKS